MDKEGDSFGRFCCRIIFNYLKDGSYSEGFSKAGIPVPCLRPDKRATLFRRQLIYSVHHKLKTHTINNTTLANHVFSET